MDNRPAYAGKSSKLRSRLRQYFIQQDSSVASYGRLDIWDLSYFQWWETEQYDVAARQILDHFTPYLNFPDETESPTTQQPIDIANPDGVVQLIRDDEREFRLQPYNRTKQKLDHLERMIDKIKLAGHSDDTKQTLYEHHRILQENLGAFLDLDSIESKFDESDSMLDWAEEY